MAVGVDYEHTYIVDARRRAGSSRVHFVTANALELPVRPCFDFAMCMTNTWGTMSDKQGVLDEMRRCAPERGTRLVSVFADTSVPARREWYRRFGHTVVEESSDHLTTDGGLRSEHFTEARLRALVGECSIQSCAGIGYTVMF